MTDAATTTVGDSFHVEGPMELTVTKVKPGTARGLKGHRPSKGAVLKSAEATVPTVDRLAQLKAEIEAIVAAAPAAEAAAEAERHRKAFFPTTEEILARNEEFLAAERIRRGQVQKPDRRVALGASASYPITRVIHSGQTIAGDTVVTTNVDVRTRKLAGNQNWKRAHGYPQPGEVKTVAQCVKDGVTMGDLRYDWERGFVELSVEPKHHTK